MNESFKPLQKGLAAAAIDYDFSASPSDVQ
jgi:hypothetical protein